MGELDERHQRFRDATGGSLQLMISETLSEADVRAKIIDPLFTIALGWPEAQIRREVKTEGSRRFIDYECGRPVTAFLIEAKRGNDPFEIPISTIGRTFKLATLLANDDALKEAIEQAARYCQEQGISHAVVTNGVQLILFKGNRTDRPWRRGEAIVFRSAAEIDERFPELWELLSYPAVTKGSLEAFFAFPDETPRHYQSVISQVHSPDEKLLRNQLNSELIPVLKAVFEDLTDPEQTKVLESCYVYSKQLQATADEFILRIQDLPPAYLASQISNVRPDPQSGGDFQKAVDRLAGSPRRGTVLLLLGGVGAGKTTFLRQVRIKYCANTIEQQGAFFYIDFRNAPENPPFDAFVFAELRRQLDQDVAFAVAFSKVCEGAGITVAATGGPLLKRPSILALLFKDELDRLEEMARELGANDAQAIAQQKLVKLDSLSDNDREVVRRAFRMIEASGRFILIALDNADQHDIQYQLKIFLFAQNVAADTGAHIISALREEKYYLASQQGAFNAFHTQKFHIPSPRLTDLLAQRLNYAHPEASPHMSA